MLLISSFACHFGLEATSSLKLEEDTSVGYQQIVAANDTSTAPTDTSGTPVNYEICDDGYDNDGDALIDCYDSDCYSSYSCLTDNDNDGFYSTSDCNDNNPNINPGANEIPNDGIDQDCNGSDLNTFNSAPLCSNSCFSAYDGVCDDGGVNAVTMNCSLGSDCSDCGERIDQDGDGVEAVLDCDDQNYNINIVDSSMDLYEPNDLSFPEDIGELNHAGDQVIASGQLLSEWDVDAFRFHFEDVTDYLFNDEDNFRCWVDTIPATLDIVVSLLDPSGANISSSDNGLFGETENLTFEGTWLVEDGGTYTLMIEPSAGSSCMEYYEVICEKYSD